MEKKGALSNEEIVRFMNQMLQALDYVHRQQLVHRDIKPSNFMVGESGEISLMDFGIAKNTDASAAEYTQTGTGVTMGTPMYMSPEQITETKSVTAQSDMYSLGVVLWQMVTGIKPYDTQTLSTFQLQMKIVQDELPSTNTVWDSVIKKATNKESEKRFKDCNEFLEHLAQMTLPTHSETTAASNSTVISSPEDSKQGHTDVSDSTIVGNRLDENPTKTDSSGEQTILASNEVGAEASPNSNEPLVSNSPQQTKKKPVFVVLAIGAVLLLVVGVLLTKGNTTDSNNEPVPSQENSSGSKEYREGPSGNAEQNVTEPQKNQSNENDEQERLRKEINSPGKYLSVRYSIDFKLIARDEIDLMIVNNAELASFQNITLSIDFYGNGSFLGSENILLSESISPGYSESWNTKIEAPSGSDDIKVSVYSAEGY
jgi:serine/threonine protein kinase